MGGKSGGSQTVKQTSAPWSAQAPYLKDLFSQAQDLQKTGGPAYYPGTTLAPQNDNQQAGQNYLLNYANGAAPQLSDALTKNLQFNLTDVLNPDSNPYLQQAAASAAQPIYQQLTQQTLPGIQQSANLSNNLGSSREAIAETGARQSADQAAANATNSLYSAAYGQGLDANSKAIATLPTTIQGIENPGIVQSGVGDAQQQYQQSVIQDALNRYNYNEQLPYANLSQYQNYISGQYGNTGTSTTSGGQTSALGTGLGGALTGGSLASLLGFGATGTGIGAGIGALIPFL